jgi:hypothetical protein
VGMGPAEDRMRAGVVGEDRMRAGVVAEDRTLRGKARWEVGRRRGFPRVGASSRVDLLFADGGAVVPVPVAVPQPSAQDNQ